MGPVIAEGVGDGAGWVACDGDPDPLGTGDNRHESLSVVGGGKHRRQQPRPTRSTRRRRPAVRLLHSPISASNVEAFETIYMDELAALPHVQTLTSQLAMKVVKRTTELPIA